MTGGDQGCEFSWKKIYRSKERMDTDARGTFMQGKKIIQLPKKSTLMEKPMGNWINCH